ncbi:uncharacterized protein LOC111901561 [Lactuca sativa]|uniref:Uncharacterized protein n=1 Tax=Lactuca sativa TaxID=4236 RepID=A0A9R1VJ75_LACSA|nr:uncharacterized protein LOC111901561 [Lactuca sativa]XP_023753193.1 uncharacterized protein LOC111901561 [Lactuca sativa]XP_023753194.1 uncharacterized protein LOC111901561 [Lactuca sativa]XP_023753195.1 uncharacterized protein LOC111901561 [Lactuca sativa]XP_023753196.1 uncharacterized protein LOC111901561 [Lactuca sativa]XP_042751479.1 uncharacterized protein LOC111901561 [Lactuca sativa]XP_052619737.1 uncharacterized protein LOC111901561 [Lactuca sativa]KAJ0207331.1 hypothetical protei
MASRKRRLPNDADTSALHKEWDEISCPICMDHPHNAVLIQCTSHSKGCRSFICDTSYRHSNCLDRFKKLVSVSVSDTNETTPTSLLPVNTNPTTQNHSYESTESDAIGYVELAGAPLGDGAPVTVTGDSDNTSSSRSNCNLKCPLCRGSVAGWEVVEEVRQYLNLKPRSCSQETCSFSGNYRELRRHARRAHPTARPSDVDPSRERAWRRLEHQREYGDIVSAIRSAMPGAVVFGDYAIENGDNSNNNSNSRLPGENRGERGTGEGGNNNNGHWWTAFFLFQMIGSMEPPPADRRSGGGGGRPRVPTRHRRRRLLWGESLLGLQDDEDDDESDDDNDNDMFGLNLGADNDEDRRPSENTRRRRRRLTRYRSDEDQS